MMFPALGTFFHHGGGAINDSDMEFRIHDRESRAARRSTSFVGQVPKAAAKTNGGPLTAAQMRRDRGRGSGGKRAR